MIEDSLIISDAQPDEIDSAVIEATVDWDLSDKRAKKYEDLLPFERAGVEKPNFEASKIDRSLGDNLKIVDLSIIMSKMKRRFMRCPVPFFAAYNIDDESGLCSIFYRKGNAGFHKVESPTVRGRSQRGSYEFEPYPLKSREKILERLKVWEKKMLIKSTLVGGCVAFVVAVLFVCFFMHGSLAQSLLLGTFSFLMSPVAAFFAHDLGFQDLQLTTGFAGVLPNEIREQFKSVRDKYDYIVVVQEVDPENWSTKAIPRPRAADPLGFGIKDGVAYLLNRFDTTPGENYMLSEFFESV